MTLEDLKNEKMGYRKLRMKKEWNLKAIKNDIEDFRTE